MVAKRSSLMMALLLAVPSAALALGLGDIHLRSHLDQPLDAQVKLLDATPGALQSLSVKLASRTTFAQYGLSWPDYLSGVHVKVVPGSGGTAMVHLTSDQPVTDPILTLLVKASWDRGVVYREYTLLLNPPVYVPSSGQTHHIAVAPAVVGAERREGRISEHPAAQAAASVAPASAPSAPTASGGQAQSVHVERGQTLSGIASRFSGAGLEAARTHQWMVAIYRINPGAFDHNMNLLRAGTVLHIPAGSTVAQVAPAAAWGEIRRQDVAWRNAQQGSGGSRAGRLRLVAPQGQAGAATAGTGTGTSGQVRQLKAQVQSLQSQLAQAKRMLKLKSAALAQLQTQATSKPTPAAQHPASPPQHAAAAPAHPAATPPVVAPKRAAAKQPERVHPQPVTRPSTGTSLVQTIESYWWALVALLVLLAVYLGARSWRARRQSAADDLLSESAESGVDESAETLETTQPSGASHEAIDVREATHEQPRFGDAHASAPVVATHVAADQTMSSETALNLEQGDPLAEADFHMAYGLYDQAADLIRIAISREPERRDLKLKLLEVFFVWGNKEQFVQTAHELAETRDEAAPGEWEKVVIMGRQLAPDDPLFAESAVSGAASQGVDLDLEGGQGRVDFDLMSGSFPAPGSATGGEGTRPAPESPTGSFNLDIDSALGESESGTTREMAAGTDLNATLPDLEVTASDSNVDTGITQEMPDHPTGEQTGETEVWPGPIEPVEPTVEQPALPLAEHDALREKVEALGQQGVDRTAELAIDDLGLDLGTFESNAPPNLGADAPTLVAGLDEHSRQALAGAERGTAEGEPAPTGTTSSWQIDERELESLISQDSKDSEDASETSRLTALDATGIDLDLGAEPASVKPNGGNGAADGNGLDFDVGTATMPHTDLGASREPPTETGIASELEPVTLSEVGTKLDLARAYMDMGDPEGARSILEEVMHEGSDAQRQEAGRLLESLPG